MESPSDLTSELIAALAAALITSVLAFAFGEVRAERQRREQRELRRIESEQVAIERLQEAAGRLADGTGLAALLGAHLQTQPIEAKLNLFKETWFQDWQAGRRHLELLAERVSDAALKRQALVVRDLAMQWNAFQFADIDEGARKAHWDKVDQEVDRLNEMAGPVYRALYSGTASHAQRWVCRHVWTAVGASDGISRERWICTR
jgi:hypothetical protein